jgi:hypothetical protein
LEYHIERSDKDFDLILKEYKEIPLSQGKVALVDAEDYEYLNQFKWHARTDGKRFYVTRTIYKSGNFSKIQMHRLIMNPLERMYIDHINSDGLDNRKCNLRICNQAQNSMNSRKLIKTHSQFKGIHLDKRYNCWIARIGISYKRKYLGQFKNEIAAALAYNEAAKKYYGEFAKLNNIEV